MVTTRRQSGALLSSQPASQSVSGTATPTGTQDVALDEDSIAYELLSLSAQKRRRLKNLEAGEDTPSKRRKLPVRNKGDVEEKHSHLSVEIPVSELESAAEAEKTPKLRTRGRKSATTSAAASTESTPRSTPAPKKHGRAAKKVDEVQAEEEQNPSTPVIEHTPEVLRKTSPVVEIPVSSPASASASAPPTSSPAKESEVRAAVLAAAAKESKPKAKKMKFNDSDDVASAPLTTRIPSPVPAPAPVDEESGSEEESDSDDEAPEEVGGKAAQSAAQSAQAAAAKAKEAKAEAERKKKAEKEERLKAQSVAALEKRRKADEAAAAAAAEASESESEEEQDDEMDVDASPEPVQKKQRIDRSNLPSELPEDFLQSDDEDEDEEMEDAPVPTKQQPRKIKFAEEKKIKDVRVGHTTYRVAKKSKGALAPKADKRAKLMKERLMGSRAGQIRKAIGGGFFGGRK